MGLSRNLSGNVFQRWSRYGPKTASNGGLSEKEVAANFARIDLELKFTQFRVRTAEIFPINCSPRWDDGNPRVYIREETLGRGKSHIPRIFLLPSSHLGEENLLNSISITKGSRRLHGPPPPRRGCCGLPSPLRAAPLHQPLHQVCSP